MIAKFLTLGLIGFVFFNADVVFGQLHDAGTWNPGESVPEILTENTPDELKDLMDRLKQQLSVIGSTDVGTQVPDAVKSAVLDNWKKFIARDTIASKFPGQNDLNELKNDAGKIVDKKEPENILEWIGKVVRDKVDDITNAGVKTLDEKEPENILEWIGNVVRDKVEDIKNAGGKTFDGVKNIVDAKVKFLASIPEVVVTALGLNRNEQQNN